MRLLCKSLKNRIVRRASGVFPQLVIGVEDLSDPPTQRISCLFGRRQLLVDLIGGTYFEFTPAMLPSDALAASRLLTARDIKSKFPETVP